MVASMAALGMEVHQQTGIERMQVLLGGFCGPPLAEAYITPAHIPLAGLSHMSPPNSREA